MRLFHQFRLQTSKRTLRGVMSHAVPCHRKKPASCVQDGGLDMQSRVPGSRTYQGRLAASRAIGHVARAQRMEDATRPQDGARLRGVLAAAKHCMKGRSRMHFVGDKGVVHDASKASASPASGAEALAGRIAQTHTIPLKLAAAPGQPTVTATSLRFPFPVQGPWGVHARPPPSVAPAEFPV